MNVTDMPQIGLGTSHDTETDTSRRIWVDVIQRGLEIGYRHIDTAEYYGNEEYIGEGIRRSDVPRDELFIGSKVWIDNLAYQHVLESLERSIQSLGLTYLDVYYIHFPDPTADLESTVTAFDELVDNGRIRNIGVSNFGPDELRTIRQYSEHPIAFNQIEMHPLLPQTEIRTYCDDNDITVVAYSPLARGRIFSIPELTDIANNHAVSEAQVSLAWLQQKGVVPIPKATNRDHMIGNFHSTDLQLTDSEMRTIDALERRERVAGWEDIVDVEDFSTF